MLSGLYAAMYVCHIEVTILPPVHTCFPQTAYLHTKIGTDLFDVFHTSRYQLWQDNQRVLGLACCGCAMT